MKQLVTAAIALAIYGSPAIGNEELKFGKSVYKQFCSHCHGLNMVNPGTSSYDLRKWPQDNKERFYSSVLKGKGDMPAWGDLLLEKEIDALWHYVATRGGKEPLPEEESAKEEVETSDLEQPSPSVLALAGLVNPGVLTACLAENGGVMSSSYKGEASGMDYQLAVGIADQMGIPLKVTWYESEVEEETTPAKDLIALLSYELCDIAPGFSLYEPILNQYTGTRGPIPDWDNKPRTFARGTQVDLQAITLSAPYMRMEIGVVYRDGVELGDVQRVSDLDGQLLGVEQGTLSGVLTLRQGTTQMNEMAKTFNPGPSFLPEMENGEFDAALVTIGAYDLHQRKNQKSTLKLHDYRHPLGFNLGVAILSKNTELLDGVNKSINQLSDDGQLTEFSIASGLHYAKPTKPYVQSRLNMRDLIATE